KEPAVPRNRDLAVGFGNDILARAAAHLLEVVLAVVRCADHFGDTVGPARRYDDAAADAPDDGRSLAVGIGRDDDGPAGGENPVEPAGDDVSRESAGKTDVMDMRCRDRLRQRLARLVAETVHATGLQHLGERLDVLEPRTRADGDDREILQIAKERRGADENVEVLRVSDVARVHDDEAAGKPVLERPRIFVRLRMNRVAVDPVRYHFDAAGARTLRLEPAAHRVADRDDAVGAPQVEADQLPQQLDQRLALEPLHLDGHLREHVLA